MYIVRVRLMVLGWVGVGCHRRLSDWLVVYKQPDRPQGSCFGYRNACHILLLIKTKGTLSMFRKQLAYLIDRTHALSQVPGVPI
jgi:hypothetical protein